MKILITGGSGTLGSALTQKIIKKNIEVVHLTREKNLKMMLKIIYGTGQKIKLMKDV